MCTTFWWGNLRERDHWGNQDVDGRIILRWIFRKWEEVVVVSKKKPVAHHRLLSPLPIPTAAAAPPLVAVMGQMHDGVPQVELRVVCEVL